MSTLIVAAMPEELRGIRGRFGGRAGVVIECVGEGAVRASASARRAIEAVSPSRVLVVGVAGGLTTGLAVGDAVVARRVLDEAGEAPAPIVPSGLCATPVDALSHVRILRGPSEKARARDEFRVGDAATVDLETAAIGRVAGELSVPYAMLRVISDAADEALPLDFESFRDADGGVRRGAIVRHVTLRPWLVPRLLEMARRLRFASRTLANLLESTLENPLG